MQAVLVILRKWCYLRAGYTGLINTHILFTILGHDGRFLRAWAATDSYI